MSIIPLFACSPFTLQRRNVGTNLTSLTSCRVRKRRYRTPYASLSHLSNLSVIWFRLGDLRTKDHGGLINGNTNSATLVTLLTVDELQSSDIAYIDLFSRTLRARGAQLFIRYGNNEALLAAEFAKELNADCIHVRGDPTEQFTRDINILNDTLAGSIDVEVWREEFRTWENDTWKMVPDEYPQFLKWGQRALSPIKTVSDEPSFIPQSPNKNNCKEIRSAHVSKLTDRVRKGEPRWAAFQKMYAIDNELAGFLTAHPDGEDIDAFADRLVRAYLDASDAYSKVDLVRTLDPVFRLGLLSPARISFIVNAYERENGRIWRQVYREGAKKLLDYLDAREFAHLRARSMVEHGATVDGTHQAKFWNWRGYLIRYVDEGKSAPNAPPLVLIHGFGASSQHFWRSISILKNKYKVYAMDVVGYGQSEKPPTKYTQDFWEYMIWQFIREVVREPAYVAGNSIGGYFSASFAADAYPELCTGLVLVNSAGRLDDPDAPHSHAENVVKKTANPIAAVTSLLKYWLRHSRLIRMLAANLLIRSLRGRIVKTLKLVYPINPDRADDQLSREIYRNSLDFGADEVLASGFVLPPQRSLSELLRKFSGPTLVFQGTLDPLNAASDRAEKIKRTLPSATIVKSESGHCPHDEDAEAFAESVSQWMETENRKRTASPEELFAAQSEEASVPMS